MGGQCTLCSSNAMPIQAVLLDLYDTLVRPDWARLRAGRDHLAARAGADLAAMREQWQLTHERRMRGLNGGLEGDLGAILDACGVLATRGLLGELAALEHANWGGGVELFPDVLDELARLRSAGYRLAIVSNASREAGGIVVALALDRAVDAVVLSCDVGALKPEPEILRIALERLGSAPSRAILVDDVPANLDAAAAMGLRTALMVRDARAAPTSGQAHPRIGDLSQLWPLLAAGEVGWS